MLLLSDALDIPLRDRNKLLTLAGFAEHYERTPIDQDKMQHLQYALTGMLERQEPYPAIVLDWDWNIVMSNRGYQRFAVQIKSMHPEFVESRTLWRCCLTPRV